MKNRSGEKIKLASIDELLGVVNEESAMEIEISKIHPFKNHPFKVLDDEKMQDLVESVKINGVLTPVLLRMDENEEYEMVSGHRRMHAAQLAGLTTIPAIVRELSDDDAIVAMVDANIQREELLPSEKAFAYKMKLDAMKRQGSRTDLTLCQSGTKSRTDQLLGEQVGESARSVQRYIRLTELIPELLDLVDNKKLQFTVAVDISYIDKEVLAEQLGVTRQSVSKWEGTQSVPDIQKIIQMSEIFGVTTDYLLKDEIEDTKTEDEEIINRKESEDNPEELRVLTMNEASEYLRHRRERK
ncbi:ParB/RepB/Spo0J family partition protein [Roseburia inulinivorans]|uniref:ParB/RepB/Spo0J family partition protein n=1 Tax=Roseburia inulinivorans TaxID=360807 RepID=UPI003AB5A0F0